jgi:hypothetical protein
MDARELAGLDGLQDAPRMVGEDARQMEKERREAQSCRARGGGGGECS